MKRITLTPLALAAITATLINAGSARAHGMADVGALSGFSHPLLGLDHLFMLIAVGTAASLISARLLIWALAGALIGAAGGFAGLSLPSAEWLAALAIAAVAGLTLAMSRTRTVSASAALTRLTQLVVTTGVALHALLHGLEAPRDSSSVMWWFGALLSSVLVCGGACLLLRRCPVAWSRAAAIVLLLIGGWLAVGPLGLLASGAGA